MHAETWEIDQEYTKPKNTTVSSQGKNVPPQLRSKPIKFTPHLPLDTWALAKYIAFPLKTSGPTCCPIFKSVSMCIYVQFSPNSRYHIVLGFVSVLPWFQSNFMVIMVVIEKSFPLLPPLHLYLAFKTAELIFTHVFRNDEIPEDIVSIWWSFLRA